MLKGGRLNQPSTSSFIWRRSASDSAASFLANTRSTSRSISSGSTMVKRRRWVARIATALGAPQGRVVPAMMTPVSRNSRQDGRSGVTGGDGLSVGAGQFVGELVAIQFADDLSTGGRNVVKQILG